MRNAIPFGRAGRTGSGPLLAPPLAALSLAALLATTACAGDASEPGTIRVAHVCGGINVATIATNAATFPEGVEVEKICFDGGAEAVQALVGGGVDAFVGSTEHVASTRSRGLDVRAYAALSQAVPYSLVSRAGSGVESVADLAGETVAVTSPGSLSDTELLKAASDAGVDYSGMNVIGAGSGASMAAAIREGGAVAGMVSEPQLSDMLASGDYTLTWEPDFDYAALVVLSRADWVEGHEEELTRFLEGLREAEDRSREDGAFAVESLADEDFAVSDEVLADAVRATLGNTPRGLAIEEPVYRDTIDLLTEVDRLDAEDAPTFDEAFDFSLLPGS
ncbi:ABC transporter substrate-binding protein [Streptomyces radicis]|uniref:ABC transporter substrate-binding protein n=1 Tax=Streptomyces radicis TaxID=1750517 RepID=A0A3A9WH18_9ACTN|nr:ABC transporter substrate-binding protein [Streptomyces radicis]RKN12521.1 ABC transporter substrate-binding protein [Streptomyces radicis]RKN27713.1 ABC transporter substrate-binding protein [Streptomyces radicis]